MGKTKKKTVKKKSKTFFLRVLRVFKRAFQYLYFFIFNKPRYGLKIIGPPHFKERINNALRLLKEKAPHDYECVMYFIDKIECEKSLSSFIKVETRTLILSERPKKSKFDPALTAGILVHEACHSELYYKGLPYRDRLGEAICLKHEVVTLFTLGAPPFLVKGYAKAMKLEWWKKFPEGF